MKEWRRARFRIIFREKILCSRSCRGFTTFREKPRSAGLKRCIPLSAKNSRTSSRFRPNARGTVEFLPRGRIKIKTATTWPCLRYTDWSFTGDFRRPKNQTVRRMIMRHWTRGWVLFAAGLVLGVVTIKSIDAQQDKGIGLRVNHVGIYVKNLQESVDFYTKTLGMREGFVMRDKSG